MITVEYLAPGTGASAVDLDDFLDQFATDSGFSTLQAAVTAAAGKHLYVNRDWTITAAVSIPADTVVQLGSGTVITQSTDATGIFAVSANNVTILGPGKIVGRNTETSASAGILATSADNLTVRGLQIQSCRFGIQVGANCDNYEIIGNRLFGGAADGASATDISTYGSSGSPTRRGVISENLCLSNNDVGIYVNGNNGDREIVVTANVVIPCDSAGTTELTSSITRRFGIITTYVGGAEARAIVSNNIVSNIAYAGLYITAGTLPAGTVSWTGNIVSGCGFGGVVLGTVNFDGTDNSLRAGILYIGGGADVFAGNVVVDCFAAGIKIAADAGWSTSNSPRTSLIGNIVGRTQAITTGSYPSPGRNLWLTNKPSGILITGDHYFDSAGVNVFVESNSVNAGSVLFSGCRIEAAGANGAFDIYGSVGGTDFDHPIMLDGCEIIGTDNTTATAENSGVKWLGNVHIRNCRIRKFRQGVSSGDTTNAARRLDRPCDNNYFEDCYYGMSGGGTGTIFGQGNRYENCTTATNGVYVNGILVGEKIQFSKTASPSTGTWAVGDIAWDSDVAAGAAPGWVCTTAGTSGTWKAMASIAA